MKSDKTIAYDYDRNGLRIRKTYNGTATNYTLNGAQITHLTKGSSWMHFYYGADDKPVLVNYNGTLYTYVYDLQGDVIALLNAAGTIVVEYKYDAWGRIIGRTGSLVGTLGYLNPFRYRGYVYDEETGLYYLRSRYYRPVWRRFINGDVYFGSIGCIRCHNIFSYCSNNPILQSDENGFDDTLFYFYGNEQQEHALRNICDLQQYFTVEQYIIDSAETFTSKWEQMNNSVTDGVINVVVINMHGYPTYMDDVDLDSLTFPNSINTLLLLSCNTGHQWLNEPNFAERLLSKSGLSVNQLVATDGLEKRDVDLGFHIATEDEVPDLEWRRMSACDVSGSKGYIRYRKLPHTHAYYKSGIGDRFNSVYNMIVSLN